MLFRCYKWGVQRKKAEVVSNLHILTSLYGSWITNTLANDKVMNDAKFEVTGQEIIDKCIEANRRMNVGIDLIESDEKVYQAFMFMNQAMYFAKKA